MRFRNRREAGQLLAQALATYKGSSAVIYALPRGGVVVGVEVARNLQAPLDLIIPRKIGHPFNPEYAICAVTEEGNLLCNPSELEGVDPAWLKEAIKKEQAEAKRRRRKYLAGRAAIPVKGKTAIITDDGVATGLTMLAAIQEVKDRGPAKVIVAVPVVPQDIARQMKAGIDELVTLEVAEDYLGSVGAYYDEFEQVEDEEVLRLLQRS